jgi:hypothetical protein
MKVIEMLRVLNNEKFRDLYMSVFIYVPVAPTWSIGLP